MNEASPKAVLDRQMELITNRDIDGLMAQYHPEAVLLRFDRVAHGLDEIRTLLATYLGEMPTVKSLDAFAEDEDTLSYQATMQMGEAVVRSYGAWVLKDGKIWRQIAGLL